MEIVVLRLGHRIPRDERISTHVCLVARAFGAKQIFYSGQHDSGLEKSVVDICRNWGGDLAAEYARQPRKVIEVHKKNGFRVCHLTMYGMPLPEKLVDIRNNKKVLVIVGSEQVPKEFYGLADYNISITGQPHSEVAALAIFLNGINNGRYLKLVGFKGARIRIEPSDKEKRIKRVTE